MTQPRVERELVVSHKKLPGPVGNFGCVTTLTVSAAAKSATYFYRTPVEFFTPTADVEIDPADTDKGAVGVLDRNGVVRKVRASGHWIVFPRVGCR